MPKEATEGTCIDRKCPLTSNVSNKRWILSGVVTKMKMQRATVILLDYLHYLRKYNHFEKHKNMSVHLSPYFRDVLDGQCCHSGAVPAHEQDCAFRHACKDRKATGTKKQFHKF
ncbi:unnamed protein product, partial [Gulo gulo]